MQLFIIYNEGLRKIVHFWVLYLANVCFVQIMMLADNNYLFVTLFLPLILTRVLKSTCYFVYLPVGHLCQNAQRNNIKCT